MLEDEPIVALDIEGILIEAGFDVQATLPSSMMALEWLETNDPDVVVLDIHLQDGSCVDVARRLVKRAVPFIVFTGAVLSEQTVNPIFLEGQWVEKPSPSEKIVAAIQNVVAA